MNAGRRNQLLPFCNLLRFIITHRVVPCASSHHPQDWCIGLAPCCRVHSMAGPDRTRPPWALSPKPHFCSVEMLTLPLRPRSILEKTLHQRGGGLSPFRFRGRCRGHSELPPCVLMTLLNSFPTGRQQGLGVQETVSGNGEKRHCGEGVAKL